MDVHVKVPFEELMEVIERYLKDKKLVKPTEFIVYADVGIPVDDSDMVDIDLEVDVYLPPSEANVIQVPKDNTVIDLNSYRERQAQGRLPLEKEDEDLIDEL